MLHPVEISWKSTCVKCVFILIEVSIFMSLLIKTTNYLTLFHVCKPTRCRLTNMRCQLFGRLLFRWPQFWHFVRYLLQDGSCTQKWPTSIFKSSTRYDIASCIAFRDAFRAITKNKVKVKKVSIWRSFLFKVTQKLTHSN